VSLTLVTRPTAEPVSLERAKLHLRIEPDVLVEDAYVQLLIAAARGWVEGETNRVLLTQTWEASFDRFPTACRHHPAEFRLPCPPLQSVASITYIASDGTVTTLDPATYLVRAGALPGRVTLAPDHDWPDTRCQPDAVTIRYVAGYGDADMDVPAALAAALLLQLGDLYAYREAQIVGTIIAANPTAARLCAPYRVLEAV
jgi:uncharacterized phiE125 gp8 family phage protein